MSKLETMSEICMSLLSHGEVTNKDIDIFDRENALDAQVFLMQHTVFKL